MKNNDRFKFRVWNKTTKKYIYEIKDYNIMLSSNGDIHAIARPYTHKKDIFNYNWDGSLIIEQCTGVKDKNGKLIYEGDILATSNTQPEAAEDFWAKEYYGYTAVLWHDGFLCFTCTEWNFEPVGFDSVYSLDFVEVVGNVHENPELLER